MIDAKLMDAIVQGYGLPVMGTHGLPHWARVLENGLRLAERTGANKRVVSLFAVFHDARRECETADPEHGVRGALLARDLRADHLGLSDDEFALLEVACAHHTDGTVDGDVTVGTCWDADRLDLWRVFIVPRNKLLCTSAAKDPQLQEWAQGRSLANHIPSCVFEEWLANKAV